MSMPKWPTFTSALAPVLTELIAEQQALGYHPKEAQDFARFDRFCQTLGHATMTLPRTLVEQWTTTQPGETETNHQRRMTLMRVLAHFMQRSGLDAWSFPPQMAPRSVGRYVPYIFTRQEIAALLTAVDQCPEDPRSPNRGPVLSMLFRILYGSGLRAGEALQLQHRDVDVVTGTLHIRNAKGHKDRRVPLHPDLADRLAGYLVVLPCPAVSTTPVFPNRSGEPYATLTLYGYFRRFLNEAGIAHGGRGLGPRLHDLRHTHAVHCLQQWIADGVDLTVALPYLSAYLGHTGLKSTQEYLRLTAELYPSVVAVVEEHWGSLIPGGDGHAY